MTSIESPLRAQMRPNAKWPPFESVSVAGAARTRFERLLPPTGAIASPGDQLNERSHFLTFDNNHPPPQRQVRSRSITDMHAVQV
jgi:hypothetical protein